MKFLLSLILAIGTLHASPELIFNGKDLTGWKIEGGDYWSVKDGVLVGQSDDQKKESHLWTKKSFKDFTFEAEFRFDGHIDSGFFLRSANDQIQLGISGSLKRDMTGSPYIASLGKYPVEAKDVAKLLKPGEWNRMTITAKGATYQVELNDKMVLEYKSGTAKDEGPIGIQVHKGLKMKIELRNLKLEKLDD